MLTKLENQISVYVLNLADNKYGDRWSMGQKVSNRAIKTQSSVKLPEKQKLIGLKIEWRRRELNPRPQILRR